ncbi:hypothetical protein HYX01_02530 [Candidatus Woesearchaeota archaeon]|nr:hypothetical protein [Candidatus Woesearchaeota archaeon]
MENPAKGDKELNSSGISIIIKSVKNVYENHYKKLLIIPFALLLIALILIGIKFANSNDFMNRAVSLKGGVTITLTPAQQTDTLQLKEALLSKFPENDISTRVISQFGSQAGIIVEADIKEDKVNEFIGEIRKASNLKLEKNDYSVEIVGSSLGASFFKETMFALLLAFVFMSLVVFIYFRTFVPSMAVILAAFSDMVVTLAIINFLDIRISGAGIAAFLMLIGYSVDTDILLSTRLLKRKEGSEMERIYSSISTGMMMNTTTIIAAIIALIFTQSEVIDQIMIIILIGMAVDMINTWIQNVGILRLYLEKKARKAQ